MKRSRQTVQRALEKDLTIRNTDREFCPICCDHPLNPQHGAGIRFREADGCFVRIAVVSPGLSLTIFVRSEG